jgi:hypothetical protein
MLLKKTIGGIRLVHSQSGLEYLRSYADDERDRLSFDFKVYAADEYFRSFTEPYSEIIDQVLYFDNWHVTKPGDAKLTLSAHASNQDFKDADNVVLHGVLEPRDRLLPPEFVLRIFFNKNSGLLAERKSESIPPSYYITFRSRQRYWKYYLLGDMARENYYVIDQDRQVEFDSLGQVTLCDQRRAYAFRTKQTLPLNDYYNYHFQLREKDAGSDRVVMSLLPVASISQIGKEVIAEQESIVSEIYLNG